jgi:hypothetical protein
MTTRTHEATLVLPALSAPGGVKEMFLVNPDELAAALEAEGFAA